MSEENVEAARRLLEIWNSRDLAAMTDSFIPSSNG